MLVGDCLLPAELNGHAGLDCRQGARFAKWRAALPIGEGLPSSRAIDVNCEELAQYAKIAQVRQLHSLQAAEVSMWDVSMGVYATIM